MVRQHYATRSGDSDKHLLIDSIQLALVSKATSTLHSRAGPVLRFVHHCKNTQVDPFPLLRRLVFNYMDMECAPTFCRSFLGSIAFMHFVLGLDSGGPILASSIITGMATDCYMLKRKAVQRPPLKVWHVEWLEKLACGKVGRSAIDQVAAGFFCYLVYARARFRLWRLYDG